jgi:hypothetical protein
VARRREALGERGADAGGRARDERNETLRSLIGHVREP